MGYGEGLLVISFTLMPVIRDFLEGIRRVLKGFRSEMNYSGRHPLSCLDFTPLFLAGREFFLRFFFSLCRRDKRRELRDLWFFPRGWNLGVSLEF